MESITEGIAGIVAVVALGLFGVLVARKRKHLRLVVRVLDHKDQNMVNFLEQLVASGELQPARHHA
jgi:hypothetical protein